MTRCEAGIAAINAATANCTDAGQLLIAAKCRGLLAGYHARWSEAPYVTITAEEILLSEMWNPETGKRSRTFRIASKKDALCFNESRIVLFDHKTTSEDISDPNAPYWRQLVVEAQPSHYMLVEWLNGRKVDDAVWDVVRKPGISPKAISTKRDVTGILQSGRYFNRPLSLASLDELEQTGRETLEMYEARLAYDCSVERPQWYFQRRSVPRLDSEIHEWATELWEHGQEIIHARYTKRWSRNSGACMLYKTPCAYLGICSGHDTEDSDNWQRKQFVHNELSGIEGDGRDILTNSRIRCFQTCRRKHYYHYELGIERQDEEEREALYFGTLMHKGLEAWFLAGKGETNGNATTDGSPANGVGTTSVD